MACIRRGRSCPHFTGQPGWGCAAPAGRSCVVDATEPWISNFGCNTCAGSFNSGFHCDVFAFASQCTKRGEFTFVDTNFRRAGFFITISREHDAGAHGVEAFSRLYFRARDICFLAWAGNSLVCASLRACGNKAVHLIRVYRIITEFSATNPRNSAAAAVGITELSRSREPLLLLACDLVSRSFGLDCEQWPALHQLDCWDAASASTHWYSSRLGIFTVRRSSLSGVRVTVRVIAVRDEDGHSAQPSQCRSLDHDTDQTLSQALTYCAIVFRLGPAIRRASVACCTSSKVRPGAISSSTSPAGVTAM